MNEASNFEMARRKFWFEAMIDGIFHNRSQYEFGHLQILNRFINFPLEFESITEAGGDNRQIVTDAGQLLTDIDNITAFML